MAHDRELAGVPGSLSSTSPAGPPVGATGCGGDERPPGCFVCDLSLFDCTPVALGVNTFSWAKNGTDTWTCVAR